MNDRIPTYEITTLLAVLHSELVSENHTMTARSPPARPHIGIHLSSNFRPAAGDWAEDDAWDSASDSESPRQSSISRSWNHPSVSTSTTAPKPVPRPANDSSSSTLAFSYTHVTAPNPSSYPREETLLAPKGGWTLIKKARKKNTDTIDSTESGSYIADIHGEGPGDADVEGDMIITDMESEEVSRDRTTIPGLQSRSNLKGNKDSIRPDVDEIVHGIVTLINTVSILSNVHTHRSSSWSKISTKTWRAFHILD